MRPSRNVIEQTWLAYALDADASGEPAAPRLERVRRHYAPLVAEPLQAHHQAGGGLGIALWTPDDPRRRWPLWLETEELAVAMTGAPTGWRRLVGERDPQAAAAATARALAAEPERAAALDPPFVAAMLDARAGELTIVNDFLGAARLYEMSFDGGRVWSNRLGALPLFAGIPPVADHAAWAVFAAAGWFLGTTTPVEGTRKIEPASVIRVDGAGNIRATVTDAPGDAVRPRRARIARSAELAAEQARGMASDIGAVWTTPIAISLTGGRDSRVSAAAALAARIDATFNTGDQVPGEVDVVRDLLARAPRPMDHTVHSPEPEEPEGVDLAERLRRIHLVHDGMRNPQEVRRPTELPLEDLPPPTLSGHGGELGHGFYYPNKQRLRRLRRGGEAAVSAQLERNARRRHSAATDEAYALYLEECRRTLDAGRSHGLSGPVLLDWFYMAQRLPYRSGLGARSARWSACTTPGFVRGAFDLSPRQRLSAKLHREVVKRLVPAWDEVPFFRSDEAEEMPEIKRLRIWERSAEAAAVEEMIAAREGWPDMLVPERIEEMWREVREGGGSSDYEHVFYRLVWRAAFEGHLRDLGRAVE